MARRVRAVRPTRVKRLVRVHRPTKPRIRQRFHRRNRITRVRVHGRFKLHVKTFKRTKRIRKRPIITRKITNLRVRVRLAKSRRRRSVRSAVQRVRMNRTLTRRTVAARIHRQQRRRRRRTLGTIRILRPRATRNTFQRRAVGRNAPRHTPRTTTTTSTTTHNSMLAPPHTGTTRITHHAPALTARSAVQRWKPYFSSLYNAVMYIKQLWSWIRGLFFQGARGLAFSLSIIGQSFASSSQPQTPPSLAVISSTTTSSSTSNACNQIDHNFIIEQEGYNVDLYVPIDKDGIVFGSSGASIANGLDLGSREDLNDLKKAGLSPALANKLTPYLGVKTEDAVALVKAKPLKLTPAEAKEVALAVTRVYDKQIIRIYNKNTTGVKFEALPSQAQTVLASVSHQYWSLNATKNTAHAFFKAATQQNWKQAAQELEKMGQKEYSKRRKAEAQLLLQIVK